MQISHITCHIMCHITCHITCQSSHSPLSRRLWFLSSVGSSAQERSRLITSFKGCLWSGFKRKCGLIRRKGPRRSPTCVFSHRFSLLLGSLQKNVCLESKLQPQQSYMKLSLLTRHSLWQQSRHALTDVDDLSGGEMCVRAGWVFFIPNYTTITSVYWAAAGLWRTSWMMSRVSVTSQNTPFSTRPADLKRCDVMSFQSINTDQIRSK